MSPTPIASPSRGHDPLATIPQLLLDALAVLPDGVNGEVVGDELVASPRPALPHVNVAGAVFNAIRQAFGRGGGAEWIIVAEPQIRFVDAVVVPDIAGWRRTRLPELPEATFITLAPDWVCEVLSPSTARFDRTTKLPLYARERVGHAWVIDPKAKSLEVLEHDQEGWSPLIVAAGAERVYARPFETEVLDLSELWAR